MGASIRRGERCEVADRHYFARRRRHLLHDPGQHGEAPGNWLHLWEWAGDCAVAEPTFQSRGGSRAASVKV